MPALTDVIGIGDRALMHIAPDPAAPLPPRPRPDAGSTRFNVKLSEAALRELAQRLYPPSEKSTKADPQTGLANLLSFWERILGLIAEERKDCDCAFCAACLARGALAGPQPGERWDEWERLKEITRERLRDRPAASTKVSREAVEAAMMVLKQAVA